jgi:hypothetical protein
MVLHYSCTEEEANFLSQIGTAVMRVACIRQFPGTHFFLITDYLGRDLSW